MIGGMVMLLMTGLVPTAAAGLLAAGAMVLCGVLTMEQAYRAISWTTVILVGGMIPLSTAMQLSGAATRSPRCWSTSSATPAARLLLGIFVLTAVVGALISNMATALIVIPIAVSASAELGISPGRC